MRDKEFRPLVTKGFKDIAESELHKEFVDGFSYKAKDNRNNLLIELGRFLNEFKTLNITAEVWIDGSFATEAPDPSDVDMVFYFNTVEVDALEADKKQYFERLFRSRKLVKSLYNLDVFYGERGSDANYNYWQRVFGTWYDNVTTKGIFRLIYQ